MNVSAEGVRLIGRFLSDQEHLALSSVCKQTMVDMKTRRAKLIGIHTCRHEMRVTAELMMRNSSSGHGDVKTFVPNPNPILAHHLKLFFIHDVLTDQCMSLDGVELSLYVTKEQMMGYMDEQFELSMSGITDSIKQITSSSRPFRAIEQAVQSRVSSSDKI